jgi:hypothetical protein
MPSVAASAAISAVLRTKPKAAEAISRAKCLATLCLLITAPTARPISAVPRSGSRLRTTAAWLRTRSRSVAASRSSRLRVRSAARSGLRQTTRRSPGKSAAVMLAISRWSNSESCNVALSSSALIVGARSAVIPSRPADLMSSVMRAWVIMPRSLTRTTWSRWKRYLSLVTCAARVIGSAVLPSNTSMATGQPSGAQSRP